MPRMLMMTVVQKRPSRSNMGRLPAVRAAMPRDWPDRRRNGGGGWQPLQGGEYPRQELHARRNPPADGTGGRQHYAIPGDARYGRPPGGSGGGTAHRPYLSARGAKRRMISLATLGDQ